jgi:type VI secretion system protein ImpA
LIAEGNLTAEDFDSAVTQSSKAYYVSLAENLDACVEAFNKLDETVDKRFGSEAPRLAEIRTAIEDCNQTITKLLKKKRELEPDPEPEVQTEDVVVSDQEEKAPEEGEAPVSDPSDSAPTVAVPTFVTTPSVDPGSLEQTVWEDALRTLKTSGIQTALKPLFAASVCAPSVRDKNRYQLLMAKLCLKADRPDLARPIAEKLHSLIEELQLERWEAPTWIAEVLDTLYRCLTAEGASDDDLFRAKEVMQRICTTDVTKAMTYRS